MIDLKKTKLFVLTYPTFKVDQRTNVYFLQKGMPYQNICAAYFDCSVLEARNRLMTDLIKQASQFDWFILMDHDVSPFEVTGALTDPFLDDVDAGVVGAEYNTGNDGSWLTGNSFHMGCVRIRGSVLNKIESPWFMFEYTEDGTHITKCECGFYRDKLLQAGVKIERRGKVEHKPSRTWHGA